MAIIIKTDEEIAHLREGGPIAARILKTLAGMVQPGITTMSIELAARELITDAGGSAAFLGYKPEGEKKAFPAALCISVNEEVVHGLPGDRVLKSGDIVSIDLGFSYKKVILDLATTVAVGKISHEDAELLATTHEALAIGCAAARAGGTTGDIGHAIESYIRPFGFGIVREFAGHGVGRYVHEDPYVPNFGKAGTGATLKPGMVIAIEPMCTRGSEKINVASDGMTIITSDGSRAAHFEHTVLITENGSEILTI